MKQPPRNLFSRLLAGLPRMNRRALVALAFAAVFTGAMAWLIPPDHPRTRAASNQAATALVTPTAAPLEPTQAPVGPTRTPLPPEYLNNGQQTVGMAFFGAALVLIVALGVLLFMPRGEQ